MSTSTPLYNQLLGLLSQHTQYRDFRHLKALAWMINALICSSKINLSQWESYVISRANQAQSTERRWHRFVHNRRIKVRSLYEDPTLQTLWQYAMRFRIEELFLDSKSGVFELAVRPRWGFPSMGTRTKTEESKIRQPQALERLYLVVALALLFATAHGMTVQLKGLRQRVDPHYRRGLSYLKIGIRWLKGVLHKNRDLFDPMPLFSHNIQPCFASKKARREYYDAIWFTRISEVKCLNI